MKKLTVFIALIAFFGLSLLNAQTRTVTGTVTSSEDGMGIPGVNVIVKGTTVGTPTDIDGKYTINVPEGYNVLSFDALGFTTQEVTITGSVINVVLQSSNITLDEVVVVAYGTSKKSSFTGSASSVKAEKLEKLQADNVTKALSGMAAGVQTTSGSGQPGTEATVRIRGIGSLNASASPLYVVDGFPFNGDLNSIAPSDIASMSILKDASATALYGSRGANGVIMITTKNGKKGDTKFSAKATVGVSDRALPEYDRISVPQYYEKVWERIYMEQLKGNFDVNDPSFAAADKAARAYASANLISKVGGYNAYDVANGEVVGLDGKINSAGKLRWNDDWQDELFRAAIRQEYVASASGATETTKYYISANYLNSEGIVRASQYEKFSGRLNLETKVRKYITVGLSMNAATSNQNFPNSSGSAYSNPFMYTRMIAPIYPVFEYDQNGVLQLDEKGNKLYDYGSNFGHVRKYSQASNPVATIELDKRINKNDIFTTRGFVEAKFLKDFTFKVSASADYNSYTGLSHQNSLFGDASSFLGRSTRTSSRTLNFNANEILTYEKQFGDHNINILAGHENSSLLYNRNTATRTGFPFGGLYELDAAAVAEGSGSYEDSFKMDSYLSRLNYDYKGKYYFSLSWRTDGSSRFAADQRWGQFWSIGGSWRISEEEFMKNFSWLTNARLKASYGSTGNQSLGTYYAYQGLYSLGYADLKNPGLIASRKATPNLTWEKIISANVGVDFTIFERFNFNVEYWTRTSDDLLFSLPQAPSSGWNSVDANVGKVQNRGIDVEIQSTVFRSSDFTWDINLNLSHFRNELLELPQAQIISGTKKWMVGRSIYDFWIQDFAGVDPETGKSLWWRDAKASDKVADIVDGRVKTSSYSSASRYYKGTSIPDLTGGITNSFRYKDFDLSFLVTFGIGGKVLDDSYAGLMDSGRDYGNAWHVDILNSWTPTNTTSQIPAVGNEKEQNSRSTRFLFDASYLQFKNITLGYNLPNKWLDRVGVDNARIFGTVDNLYTFTSLKGMDPLQSLAGVTDNIYTPLRTISFGMSFNF